MNDLKFNEALLDPLNFQAELDLDGSANDLVWYLETMKMIRAAEYFIASQREQGFIGGPVHLGIGQEAIAVGVSKTLEKSDKVFGAHRSHAHLLALGGDVRKLFAELLGKNTGVSLGMGGSMHLWDEPNGFWGSAPIVAGTVSLAVGAGLAGKLANDKTIAVSYLGDGALEEGVVHESLNLASVLKIPVIFVVENNLFASHMELAERQPNMFAARFAKANCLPFEIVDGNDVVAVHEAMLKAASHARNGEGPYFVEAITYRWLGHVDWREDIDVGLSRSAEGLRNWKARDPIRRLREAMMKVQIWSAEKEAALDQKIQHELKNAWNLAMGDPYPDPGELLSRVYSHD